jgi:hypothetical protein
MKIMYRDVFVSSRDGIVDGEKRKKVPLKNVFPSSRRLLGVCKMRMNDGKV